MSQDGFSMISSIILLEENVHCAIFTSKFLEWAFCAHLLFLSWVYSSRLASYRCRNMKANGEEQEARILPAKPTLNMVSITAWRTGMEGILVSPGMGLSKFQRCLWLVGIFASRHRGLQTRRSVQCDEGSNQALGFWSWSGFRSGACTGAWLSVQTLSDWCCHGRISISTGYGDQWMASLMPGAHLRSTECCEGNRIHSRSTCQWECGHYNATRLFFFLDCLAVLSNCLSWTKLATWMFRVWCQVELVKETMHIPVPASSVSTPLNPFHM